MQQDMSVANGEPSVSRRPSPPLTPLVLGHPCPHSEDVYYVEAMAKVGGRIADRAAGLAFSVESVYAEGALGFHAAYALPSIPPVASPHLTSLGATWQVQVGHRGGDGKHP